MHPQVESPRSHWNGTSKDLIDSTNPFPSFFPRKTLRLMTYSLLILTVLASPLANGTRHASDDQNRTLTTKCRILRPSTTSVLAGSSGTILFTCGGKAALKVLRNGQATPIFILPRGYRTLAITPHIAGATDCKSGQGLTSGQIFQFTKKATFDYCAAFSNPPSSGLSGFSLVWTVAQGHGHNNDQDNNEQDHNHGQGNNNEDHNQGNND
jgi:hypothetical protein